MNYFGGAVQLGADLKIRDAWIPYPSQIPQDILEPSYQVPRFLPEPVSLHLLYAKPYALHPYSANTLLRRTLFIFDKDTKLFAIV